MENEGQAEPGAVRRHREAGGAWSLDNGGGLGQRRARRCRAERGEPLTQDLRGGALQGLLPYLLNGTEVYLGRLGQGCAGERGVQPCPSSSRPPSGDPSFHQRECAGATVGSGWVHVRGRWGPGGMCEVAQARGKGGSVGWVLTVGQGLAFFGTSVWSLLGGGAGICVCP